MRPPRPPSDDHALVTRISSADDGDAHAAFRDLYLAYAPPLVGYASAVVHDNAAAEDLVHDVFTAIWNARREWRPAGSVAAYLYRAARNRALDYRDRSAVRHRVSIDAVDDDLLELTEPMDVTYEAESAGETLSAAVTRAIAALPERRRLALTLRVVHGMEYDDVARVLNVSPTAARILVTRAREALQSLRHTLRGSDAEPDG
jgi:RNA polymerase sigma factor (sigma-70 family)